MAFRPVQRALLLVCMAGALIFGDQTRAATLNSENDTRAACNMWLSGQVATGDAKRLTDLLKATELNRKSVRIESSDEHPAVLCLDSPGGNYVEALRVMDIMLDRNVGTVIEE